MPKNYLKEYEVDTLSDFMQVIDDIEKLEKKNKEIPFFSPLWYRGHEYSHYNLLPSIMRGTDLDIQSNDNYSSLHLIEDYRYQIFKSRGYDHVNTNPDSKTEWQELMQHYNTQTRMMDWSESAITSLIFALESYLDPKDNDFLKRKRRECTPTVWVLRPYLLNKKVYEILSKRENANEFIERVLDDLITKRNERKMTAKKMADRLSNNSKTFFSDYNENNGHKFTLCGTIGLSVIESYRKANGYRLKELIQNNEFNPFFYLLLRYYTDGVPAEIKLNDQLPPLAIIHPYHSNRIKAQRGAFTVFPYYGLGCNITENNQIKKLKKAKVDLRCMENQNTVKGYLYKIRLTNPERIANQLLVIGSRRSSIYPELQNFSDDIESTQYHY